jgi:hypothetical protein
MKRASLEYMGFVVSFLEHESKGGNFQKGNGEDSLMARKRPLIVEGGTGK